MDGVTIRRAIPADKQSVLAIRNDVYDGRDYLPSYYDKFMASEHHIAFVAEVDGKVVSFIAGFLLDDGETVVSRAGRVSKEYSGEKVYKRLKSHLLAQSGARVNASSVCDVNPVVNKPMFLKENRHILSRPFFKYVFQPEDIKLPPDVQKLSSVDEELMTKYITENKYRNYLFPGGRIILDWVPFRLNMSNIPLIFESGRDLFTNVRVDSNRSEGILLSSSAFSRDCTDFYFLDVYGTDILAFREIMAGFLARMVKPSRTVDILLFFEPIIDGENLERKMNEIGMHKMVWIDPNNGRSYSTQVIFEKDIV